jgi:hypothetical protein
VRVQYITCIHGQDVVVTIPVLNAVQVREPGAAKGTLILHSYCSAVVLSFSLDSRDKYCVLLPSIASIHVQPSSAFIIFLL